MVTFKSSLRWLLALAVVMSCGRGGVQHTEVRPPGTPQQELALLERDYSFNAKQCIRTAEEVVDMQRRCSQERWADCVYAATMYSEGCGVAQNRAQAEALNQRACGFGSVLGCAVAGILTSDVELGIDLLEEPCTLGYMQACGSLGIKLLARGDEADVPRAAELLEQACRKDTRYYCGALGELVSSKQMTERFDATRALLERACDANDAKACETLARALEDGSLGVVSYERAADLNSATCYDRDHLPACNALAHMAVRGRGGQQNPRVGAWLFHSTCKRGYGPACHGMGQASEKGWVGVASFDRALPFYDRGCELGVDDACKSAKRLRVTQLVASAVKRADHRFALLEPAPVTRTAPRSRQRSASSRSAKKVRTAKAALKPARAAKR